MPEEGTTTAAQETTHPANTETQPDALLEGGGKDAGGETKTTPETKADTETAKDPKAQVPDKYEFTLPEGTTLDQTALDAFTPLAKELGLSQEAAQKLVDFELGRAKAQQEAFVKQQETWMADFKSDKEFGGEHEAASLRAANEAYKQFFTPAEMEAVKASGLANFPPLVKALARVGKLMGEGEFVQGGGTTTTAKSAAEKFYPGMNP